MVLIGEETARERANMLPRYIGIILFVTAVMAVANSYDVKNVSAVVPDLVRFECDSQSMTSILLRKGNTTVSSVSEGTELLPNASTHFTATRFNDNWILFQLTKSDLKDEGEYSCVVFNNTQEVISRVYSLKVFSKPTITVNLASVEVFEGESIYEDCKAIGRPAPTVKWKLDDEVLPYVPSNILDINNASMNDSGVYSCVAENTYGNMSKEMKVVVKDEHPSLPSLSIVNRTEKSLQVTGHRPTYAGRGDIEYFYLSCKRCPLVLRISEPGHFTQKIVDLEPSSVYTIELTACNPYVCSKPVSVNFTTAEPGKPAQPTNLKASSISSNNITVMWTHGNHYKTVYYSQVTYTEGKLEPKTDTVKGQMNAHVIKNLKPFTSYTITVVTCIQFSSAQVLCSDASMAIFVTTAISAPSPPRDVSAKNSDGSEISVIVEWKPSEFVNGPSVSYKVLFRIKGETKWRDGGTDKGKIADYGSLWSPKSFELKGLLQMTKYEIMVSAFNKAGNKTSLPVVIETDTAPPEKPSNLTLLQAKSTSLLIQWGLPPQLPPGITVCYHVGVRMKADVPKYLPPICNGSISQVEIKSLQINTTYVVSLYASFKRPRDQKLLNGNVIEEDFETGIPPRPTTRTRPNASTSNTSLVIVTVLCIIIIIAVSGLALLYCRRRQIFSIKNQSIFYVDEGGNRPLASRLSMRNTERKPAAISVDDFPDHVASLHADSDYLFSEEFHSLAYRPDFTWEHSTLHLNQPKNRYQDIVAYDHSRVRLMSMDGVPASNYINANFIDGFQKKPAYIATQAPLNHTIEDFWRMVWEQDVRIIVMLTNLIERGKRKCDQYWPHHGEVIYGLIRVKTIEEYKYAHYVHRVFEICWNDSASAKAYGYKEDDWRIVRQFHFTDWPDFGVPRERTTMLSFVQMVRKYMQENDGPSIVHCSAGVGRSGTFIVIEAQIERINRKQNVNVYGYLKEIRSQRNYLVQQEVQYIFLHDALADYIKCGLTAIPVAELDETLEQDYFTINPDTGLSVIDEEWQILSEFNIHEYEMVCGKRPCNQQKNRDSFTIPVDSSRVRLTMRGAKEGTDYINANYVDSYLRKNSFIVTQMPLHDTVEDFWRMTWENYSCIIVSLLTDEELSKEDVLSYLPRDDCNPINFGSFEVHCASTCDFDMYRLRELELVGRVEWGESERRKVYHYQFLNWPENKTPIAGDVFELVSAIKNKRAPLPANNENSPIIVHCSCGVGRSGVFCALWNIKEQMDNIEETVDVFSVVRLMRRQRPLIIQNMASYEFLYTAAQKYKESMVMYPNKEEEKHKDEAPFSMGFSEEVRRLIDSMEEDSDDSETQD